MILACREWNLEWQIFFSCLVNLVGSEVWKFLGKTPGFFPSNLWITKFTLLNLLLSLNSRYKCGKNFLNKEGKMKERKERGRERKTAKTNKIVLLTTRPKEILFLFQALYIVWEKRKNEKKNTKEKRKERKKDKTNERKKERERERKNTNKQNSFTWQKTRLGKEILCSIWTLCIEWRKRNTLYRCSSWIKSNNGKRDLKGIMNR